MRILQENGLRFEFLQRSDMESSFLQKRNAKKG